MNLYASMCSSYVSACCPYVKNVLLGCILLTGVSRFSGMLLVCYTHVLVF